MPITQSRMLALILAGENLSTTYHMAITELKMASHSHSLGDISTEALKRAIDHICMNSTVATARDDLAIATERIWYQTHHKRNEMVRRYMERRKGTTTTTSRTNHLHSAKTPQVEYDEQTQQYIDEIKTGKGLPDEAGAALASLAEMWGERDGENGDSK